MIRQTNLKSSGIILPLLFVVFGIILGSISSNYLDASQESEMQNYFVGFTNMVNYSTVDRNALFQTSVLYNTKLFLLMVFMGISVIGIPFIYGVMGVKGFIVGFTAGITAGILNGKGVLLILCLILPKELILIPTYMVIAVLSATLCNEILHMIFKKKKSASGPGLDKKNILKYMLQYIPCYLLLLIGCFFEAYICPVLLKMIF